ncbi:Aspartyl aminopeptidase [Nitrincola lacisaponensis]|uniref:M18 family aminopeptidase n=1 Tax=Nitrincola lacisaponensis TaxID=267850 RepID=A0A063Y365_9GAMM|nr:M18 family aminopeptidase [Nitrincola lacisaponensis]KDE38937.1 Aspartyl aminopeptidase [Nitrincola lacisaponensis]
MNTRLNTADFNQALLNFLDQSPTPFHAVASIAARLDQAGFMSLKESDPWVLQPGQGYYTTRNGSSIIAWRQPVEAQGFAAGLRLTGAHTDSPCLKVKPQPELLRQGYFQLGVEVYGGVLLNPWFDRDLSLAGRVTVRQSSGQLSSHLIDFKKPIAVIPSLAIHLDREANAARSINAQTYLPPILGQATEKPDFRALLQQKLLAEQVDVAAVLDYELAFYDCQKAALVGLDDALVCSARLDNLLSCFIGLQALIESRPGNGQVLICNDHEEVGSASACGAQGPMLTQWLDRVLPADCNRYAVLANSLFVSADNAHGIHPNFADRHDDNHGPRLNQGPVIKINSNQRYASNSETSARFRDLAYRAGVPVQSFVVRSDQGCGSTIGPIVATETGIPTVDVGVPQFAMHSIRETAGAEDAIGLTRILMELYQS